MSAMNPWELYGRRYRKTPRETVLDREREYLRRKLSASPSFHTALVDGVKQAVSIINSDNLNVKTICSMPGDDLPHGGYVEWMGNTWIILEKDANQELYTKAVMKQCNYLLKWVDDEDQIISRWCIVEDSTKYLTGIWENNRDYVASRGDTRVYMWIPRDKDTLKLNRNSRFLIDDSGSMPPLAYRLTKPLKVGSSYHERGVLTFVLLECQTEDTDNYELMIPNYYDHFPRENTVGDQTDEQAHSEEGGASWL